MKRTTRRLWTPWERSHRQTFATRDFHSYGLFCCSGTHKSGFVKLHPLKLKVTILGERERERESAFLQLLTTVVVQLCTSSSHLNRRHKVHLHPHLKQRFTAAACWDIYFAGISRNRRKPSELQSLAQCFKSDLTGWLIASKSVVRQQETTPMRRISGHRRNFIPDKKWQVEAEACVCVCCAFYRCHEATSTPTIASSVWKTSFYRFPFCVDCLGRIRKQSELIHACRV